MMNRPHALKSEKMYRSAKGLTLLETLVAVFILSLTIIGPLAFLANSSSYARQTKETMLATYLAEEGVELLQNMYDSLYVRCSKQFGVDPCIASGDETTGQVAWRLFKERLAAGGGYASCFLDDNPEGCSFDYIDMQADLASMPPHYDAQSSECSRLVTVNSSGLTSYVCSGLPTHISGGAQGTLYPRIIHIEALPTFDVGTRDEQYNDDLRVTVEVFYRAVNGSVRSIKIVRFIHPRS